ncbi:MAG: DUF3540 domain-containing protein [Candidatus Electrothrix sp. ATG2]|nr:DUF3540 domain-containing protein [Candidatus Electrothrix sp. ATG2]
MLVAGEDVEHVYIIGVLSTQASVIIRSGNGAFARLDNDRASLQIFSPHNELIVEYDTAHNKTKLNSLGDNLELNVPTGNMVLNSSESITIQSDSIQLTGRNMISMKVQDQTGHSLTGLSLGNHQAKLSCPDFRVIAKNGDLFVDELRVAGKKIVANLVQATCKIGKLETRAKTLIHKARNMYQSVENLSQLKTGRLKTLIKTTYHLKSKNTVLKSEEDVKVKAKEINLG